MMRTRVSIALVFGALVLPACSRQPMGGAGDPPKVAENGMLELSEIYKYIRDQKQPLPRTAKDLEQYEASLPIAYAKILEGEYVVVWGAGLSGGAGVLAYEKDAATKGGLVLLQNGEAKKVSAAEFGKLEKAR